MSVSISLDNEDKTFKSIQELKLYIKHLKATSTLGEVFYYIIALQNGKLMIR